MPRQDRYTNLSISPTLERITFESVKQAVSHFAEKGYKPNEFETRKTANGEICVMVSAQNPRDYVEIIKNGVSEVKTVRYCS